MTMKHMFLSLITVSIASVRAVKESYDGYKVFKVRPEDETTVERLKNLRLNGLGEFWDDNVGINVDVRINVAPEDLHEFHDFMTVSHIEYEEVIEDVQRTIDMQFRAAIPKASAEPFLSYVWSEYQSLDKIYAWLDELQKTYPKVVKTVEKGRSVLGKPIKGIIINYHPKRANKLIGVLEGTLHAREWICPATLTWIIKEFLTSANPAVRALAEKFEWHIFPVVNPDGYEYTFTDNRMWRKNRSPLNLTACPRGRDDLSKGVDLNRNFDFHWLTVGDPCSNTFAGPKPFSEPETRAVRDYILKISREGRLIYYIGFHSYGQMIIVPYTHIASDKRLLSSNYGDMFEISSKAAEALRKRYGTIYKVVLSSSILCPMSGSSFNWVKRAGNVPISLLFELRDRGEYGFLLPADQIIPNCMEIMDALLEMDFTTRNLGYYSCSTKVFSSFLMIVLCVFVVLFK